MLARPLGVAQLLALNGDIGEPSLFRCLRGGGLLVGGMLVATGQQLLASLAISRSTLTSVLLAFPRSITTVAGQWLYTLGHQYAALPIRVEPESAIRLA